MSAASGDSGGDSNDNRRVTPRADRRRMPRGGRRTADLAGRHPLVLVGDTDDSVRRVLAIALSRRGFDVVEATSGEQALSAVEERSPSVVIAEATLPRDDQFQHRVHRRQIPYIVTKTNDEGAVPPDAVAVLEKPFSLGELLEIVTRVIRTGRAPAAV